MRPSQITEDMVERSSTLEPEDIGKWFVIISGTLQIFSTQEQAEEYILSDKGNLSWEEKPYDWFASD